MTETSKKDYGSLEQIPCIHYLLCFQKDTTGVRALIDSNSEGNAMTPAYTLKLGLNFHPINNRAQKIDGFILDTFEMILANFQVVGRAWLFQETFLVANTTLKVIFGMPFPTLSRIDI